MKGADEFMVEEVEAMQAGVQARRMELFGRCGGPTKEPGWAIIPTDRVYMDCGTRVGYRHPRVVLSTNYYQPGRRHRTI